jgi:hypothetical protein
MRKSLLEIIILLSFHNLTFSQINPQTQLYRDDENGNVQFRREGVMDGNLIRTLFYNNGEVGQWPFQPSGEWPKGTGQTYLDGVAVLIAAEVQAQGNGAIIHPLETSYREWMDKDPLNGTIWGLEPVPGYIKSDAETPAINNKPFSWPEEWPEALNLTPEWNGFWYGYFGRGVQNSDFETFLVMDDNQDGEWNRPPYKYYPILSDTAWGGLGLRVEVRGFQWSQVLAEDIIFWHYDIVNISDFNYDKSIFGFYTDCGVGGSDDSGDDMASFDKQIDLAYCYDYDGLGLPDGWQTGYYGYAYLESPGNATNGVDDDDDGLVDERRDDGIDNDGDWISYSDLNQNGEWDSDENEPLNDDVGRDGVGPFDRQYTGPDEGEGDGIPTDGEPNFDKTDKDESDQIGLTAVSIYRLGEGGTGGGWPKDDEPMWQRMSYANFDTSLQQANISMVFASGPFPLNQNLRERFSMALVFGSDLDDIIFNKETVQQIYNANYNFSKPPIKPLLTAVPGDKQVFLYWDNVAEESRDPFLGFEDGDSTKGAKKDFEGYLVYKSKDPEFNDIKIITDSKGAPKYWKPIAQYDLVDSIMGPDPVGINGARFWRGDDTGLQYSYVDKDVLNGQRYYYALVSYDQGDPNFGTTGLQPSECSKIISQDFAGNIQFIDINCAVVTPNAPVAGYVPPSIIGDLSQVTEGLGTGNMSVNILNPEAILDGAQYKIVFKSTDDYPIYKTQSVDIIKIYNGVTDTLIKNLDTTSIGPDKISPPFDGMNISIKNDTLISVIDSLTGWIVGSSNLTILVSPDLSNRGLKWPADYEVRFSNSPQDTTYINSPPFYTRFPINFRIWNNTEARYTEVAVKDNDLSGSLTLNDLIQIVEFVGPPSLTNSRIAWNISYDSPIDPGETPEEPVEGDKFFISTTKAFITGDYFSYSTKPSTIDNSLAQQQLENVKVVPNPYISAASWEPRNLNSTGRGERKIDFIHLPAQCTIRIYNLSGALVKTLYKDSNFNDGAISWDLITEDGMDVAYGVYVYHVESPGIGEKIGKFALIK